MRIVELGYDLHVVEAGFSQSGSFNCIESGYSPEKIIANNTKNNLIFLAHVFWRSFSSEKFNCWRTSAHIYFDRNLYEFIFFSHLFSVEIQRVQNVWNKNAITRDIRIVIAILHLVQMSFSNWNMCCLLFLCSFELFIFHSNQEMSTSAKSTFICSL